MAKWIIDSDHASATFAVRHFGISNVMGMFGKTTGVIHFDPPDIARLSAEAEIDVGSLSTGHQKRDEHLLSPDFLDVSKYPKIAFRTTRVEAIGKNQGRATADLTIRGIKKPISLTVGFSGPVKSPFSGKSCIGFNGAAKISREDFGMGTNYPMEGGGLVVGKDVEISFDLQADLTE